MSKFPVKIKQIIEPICGATCIHKWTWFASKTQAISLSLKSIFLGFNSISASLLVFKSTSEQVLLASVAILSQSHGVSPGSGSMPQMSELTQSLRRGFLVLLRNFKVKFRLEIPGPCRLAISRLSSRLV